jgi:NAD(P)-dependent dehydrogenase (short-subunit alcohol dehydrogenase family)
MELFDLTGSVSLVTGGGGTLGSAIAGALHASGARVIVAGRNAERLEVVRARLAPDGLAIVADLSTEGGIEALFAAVERDVGRLDVLVNNAGVARDAQLGSVHESDFADVLRLNVSATYLCAQRALPLFGDRGKIVNIASVYGVVAADDRIYEGSPNMIRASAPYLASKAAVVQLTRDLAVRLAPRNIQVNCVSPGGIEGDQPDEFKRRYSERTPAGRMAVPSDVAGAVVFFASPASNYTTGQNLVVDGGLTAW